MGEINIPGVVAIVVFYVIILLIGLWAARRRKQGEEEAMLAGRSIGLYIGTFTPTATWVGGGYINGTAEGVYDQGLVWATAPWGYSIALAIGGFAFAKIMRKREYYTILDPFQEKYGARMGGLLFIPALLGDIFWSAAILAALGATISVVLSLDRVPSIIASACIAIFYTLIGGFYSVVYTDVIQLSCIFLGLWISISFALTNSAVSDITVDSKEWLEELPIKYLGSWLDQALLPVLGGVPWQVYFQRVMACKTPKKAQILSVAASIGCIVMVIPAVLIGAIGFNTDWTKTDFFTPSGNATNQNATVTFDKQMILPMVLQYLTPAPVAFVGLGAVAAAVMSSTDSIFLSSSTMFARNVYKVIFRPKASEKEVVWVMRFSILVVGAAATAMSLMVNSIYSLFTLCSDLIYVILFPQLCCVIYLQGTNTYGSFMGYILGLVFRVGGGEEQIGLQPFIKYPYYNDTDGQLFPFRTFAMIVTLVTVVVVSYSLKFLFERGIVPLSYDFLHCFRKYELEKLEVEQSGDYPMVKTGRSDGDAIKQ